MMNRTARILIATVLLSLLGPVSAEEEERTVQVELIAEQAGLVPGETMQLGIRLRHEPHWHTYWLNPGDSGLATSVAWMLPEGYAAGLIQWPKPMRFDVDGLYNFGFEGDMVLPVSLRVPADAPAGPVQLQAVVKWLACREVCIPGKAAVTLELPVAPEQPGPDARHAALFAAARANQPRLVAWPARATGEAEAIVVRVDATALPADVGLDAFIEDRQVVAHGPPAIAREGHDLVVRFTRSEYFSEAPKQIGLVLTATGSADAWRLEVPFVPTAQP